MLSRLYFIFYNKIELMAITLFKSQTNVQDKKGHRDYISSGCLNGKILGNVCLEVHMRFDEKIVIYYRDILS